MAEVSGGILHKLLLWGRGGGCWKQQLHSMAACVASSSYTNVNICLCVSTVWCFRALSVCWPLKNICWSRSVTSFSHSLHLFWYIVIIKVVCSLNSDWIFLSLHVNHWIKPGAINIIDDYCTYGTAVLEQEAASGRLSSLTEQTLNDFLSLMNIGGCLTQYQLGWGVNTADLELLWAGVLSLLVIHSLLTCHCIVYDYCCVISCVISKH